MTASGMTLFEYMETPETVEPRELVDGILRAADSPLVPHQMAVTDFLIAIATHVHERELGDVLPAPMDVILDVERPLVVQPDLLYVSNQRRAIISDRIFGAPDLVLEILSPQPRIGHLDERVAWFAQYGVRECWLFHQDRRQLVVLTFENQRVGRHRLFDRSTPIDSIVLPDFQLTLDAVMRWRY